MKSPKTCLPYPQTPSAKGGKRREETPDRARIIMLSLLVPPLSGCCPRVGGHGRRPRLSKNSPSPVIPPRDCRRGTGSGGSAGGVPAISGVAPVRGLASGITVCPPCTVCCVSLAPFLVYGETLFSGKRAELCHAQAARMAGGSHAFRPGLVTMAVTLQWPAGEPFECNRPPPCGAAPAARHAPGWKGGGFRGTRTACPACFGPSPARRPSTRQVVKRQTGVAAIRATMVRGVVMLSCFNLPTVRPTHTFCSLAASASSGNRTAISSRTRFLMIW